MHGLRLQNATHFTDGFLGPHIFNSKLDSQNPRGNFDQCKIQKTVSAIRRSARTKAWSVLEPYMGRVSPECTVMMISSHLGISPKQAWSVPGPYMGRISSECTVVRSRPVRGLTYD
jgi:hypothetical protein